MENNNNNNILSVEQLDALKELMNIGSAHSATALSQLLNMRVTLNVPSVNLLPCHEALKVVEDPSTPVVAVYLKVLKDCPGKAIFLFDPDSAQHIASLLNGESVAERLYCDEISLSALKEVGNILLGSFLAALVKLTNLKLNFSVPAIAVDMAGAILEAVLLDDGYVENWVIIESKFTGNEVKGTLAFMPDPGALEHLLGALGV